MTPLIFPCALQIWPKYGLYQFCYLGQREDARNGRTMSNQANAGDKHYETDTYLSGSWRQMDAVTVSSLAAVPAGD